jgi:hypothetical protein
VQVSFDVSGIDDDTLHNGVSTKILFPYDQKSTTISPGDSVAVFVD